MLFSNTAIKSSVRYAVGSSRLENRFHHARFISSFFFSFFSFSIRDHRLYIRVFYYAIAIVLSTEFSEWIFSIGNHDIRKSIPIVGYRPSRIVGNLSLKIRSPLKKNTTYTPIHTHTHIYIWSWHDKIFNDAFYYCSFIYFFLPLFFLFFLIFYAPKFDRYLPTSFFISLVFFL